jgi:hypothetical protein
MSGRIFISHAAADAALGEDIAEFLQAMIEGSHVRAAAPRGSAPEAGDGSAALQHDLADADMVVGLITEAALASGEVPFHLGAAWALDTRVLLLIEREAGSGGPFLPVAHAESRAFGPEALVELAESLARESGASAEMGAHARAALGRLFPEFHGLDRQSTERPVAVPRDSSSTQPQWPLDASGNPVPPSERPPSSAGLPSCSASLHAGRAVADCAFHRNDGGHFADELDLPFGAFLASLGADWSALRRIDDLDVWIEAAENVLQALAPEQRQVRCFYEVGFQLSTLINLAHRALEAEGEPDELQETWARAWSALRDAALEANVTPAAIDELQPMLENLYGPQPERDVANLGRVQERIREFAAQADAAALAASA